MAAIVTFVFVAVYFFRSFVTSVDYDNKFNNVYGCKQINAISNYNDPTTYIPVDSFVHVGTGVNSTIFRIGIFGKGDAIIRFSKEPKPYNNNILHEIVIGTGGNLFTEIRRQNRFNTLVFTNHVLKMAQTPNILPELEPLVLQMEFVGDRSVRLTKNGDTKPFLEVSDPKTEVSHKYIGFSNLLSKMIYFFDCPVNSLDVKVDKLNV